MSIVHDKMDEYIKNLKSICDQYQIECIVMFAGEGVNGGVVHINNKLHRFIEEAPTILNNVWKFSQKNFPSCRSDSGDIRPAEADCGDKLGD